jgi:3-keto-5-aminohexanoate cleavage enzyme
MGMLLGGHVRVGFEDNLKYNRERQAVSNAEFVERIVRIAKELNLEIATPVEARQILGMPERAY